MIITMAGRMVALKEDGPRRYYLWSMQLPSSVDWSKPFPGTLEGIEECREKLRSFGLKEASHT